MDTSKESAKPEAVAPTKPQPPVITRNRNVGHYCSLLQGADSQAVMQTLVQKNVRGFLKRYTWAGIEPKLGTFDFDEIASDLAWCVANGMRLVPMIVDKSFSNPTVSNLPLGLQKLEAPNNMGGLTAIRWAQPVQDAFNGCVDALKAKFSYSTVLEGIATVETSTSLDADVAKEFNYTPEAYRDSYINILSHAAKTLPGRAIFWFMNFLTGHQSYIGDIANDVAPLGVSMGGPDCLPDSSSLTSQVYPFYGEMKGKMPLFIQFSAPGYNQPLAGATSPHYWTMTQMLGYMRSTLFSNYCFWMPIKKSTGSPGYGWQDVLPVVAANPVICP